jgi:hypothetical protein
MEDASSIATLIVSLFESTPQKKLSGSQLSAMLTAHRPDFVPLKYEARNLREFMRANVPQVYESARQGLDIIYSLVPPSPPQPIVETTPASFPVDHTSEGDNTSQITTHPRLWKLFVSPNAPYRLFVNPDSLAFLEQTPEEGPPEPPWVQLPPCAPAHHLQIAKDFLPSIDDAYARAKLTHITEHERPWWVPFFAAARAFGLERRWIEHRGRRLGAELARTLSAIGVPPDKIRYLRQLENSRRANAPADQRARGDAESTLRRVALSVISRMSDADLRELKLPLGEVVDALTLK